MFPAGLQTPEPELGIFSGAVNMSRSWSSHQKSGAGPGAQFKI